MAVNKNEKIIRDIVHEYIELDQFFVMLVNDKYFQRLRHIKQLTCQYVYPSANHTRFEHSLGVYYLSRRCLTALKQEVFRVFEITESEFKSLFYHLSVAALLHDVGHAPLSHLGEIYYRKDEIKTRLKLLCKDKEIDFGIFNFGSAHELMSCYIILEHFRTYLEDNEFEEYENIKVDLELICRMIVGAQYDGSRAANIAIEVLNSSTIDMDKLDYIMRDSHMTGISTPPIDVNRFFKGLMITDNTKKIVLKKQAITVVQNIIDARDCLYLLVCNHHITVYTDFVYEYYMKHLMLLHQKKSAKGFKDSLNPNEFFSCNAVLNKLVDDHDLLHSLKKHFIDNKNVSEYTATLTPQLFEHKFLKPLWKNLYEYRLFLNTEISDTDIVRDLEKKMCDSNYIYRRYVAREIMKRAKINAGEIFIVPRSNKFYSASSENNFYISVDGNLKDISELLPQKQFNNMYNNVLFYVFCKDEYKDIVKNKFVEIAREGLPDKAELEKEPINRPEWLDQYKDTFY